MTWIPSHWSRRALEASSGSSIVYDAKQLSSSLAVDVFLAIASTGKIALLQR